MWGACRGALQKTIAIIVIFLCADWADSPRRASAIFSPGDACPRWRSRLQREK